MSVQPPEEFCDAEGLLCRLRKTYGESLRLLPPAPDALAEALPPALQILLRRCGGIQETMPCPETGEPMAIGWVLLPCEQILEESQFYQKEYGLTGTVFSTDGAGDPYVLKPDGSVTCFDPIDGAETWEAESLEAFFGRQDPGAPRSEIAGAAAGRPLSSPSSPFTK